MIVFKIIVLAIFVMLSVCLLIDGIITGIALRAAIKQKVKYEKKLGMEIIMLFVWSLCLACLIILWDIHDAKERVRQLTHPLWLYINTYKTIRGHPKFLGWGNCRTLWPWTKLFRTSVSFQRCSGCNSRRSTWLTWCTYLHQWVFLPASSEPLSRCDRFMTPNKRIPLAIPLYFCAKINR